MPRESTKPCERSRASKANREGVNPTSAKGREALAEVLEIRP